MVRFSPQRVDAERWNRLNPEAKTARKPYVTELLDGRQGPAIAAADYVRAFADQIREYVPMRYTVLGTDGFDRFHIAHAAIAAIAALAADGKMSAKDVTRAI